MAAALPKHTFLLEVEQNSIFNRYYQLGCSLIARIVEYLLWYAISIGTIFTFCSIHIILHWEYKNVKIKV